MKHIDFKKKKIWVGDDSELREKVVKKLAEHNITMSPSACCNTNFSCLWIPSEDSTFGTYDQNYTKKQFNDAPVHKELSVEELLDEQVAYQIY